MRYNRVRCQGKFRIGISCWSTAAIEKGAAILDCIDKGTVHFVIPKEWKQMCLARASPKDVEGVAETNDTGVLVVEILKLIHQKNIV